MGSQFDTQVQDIIKWLGTGSINIFGWPFSGKDTQANQLAKLFDSDVIGGGEILRSNSDTPKHVRDAIDIGYLAPTDDYINIITPYISKKEFNGKSLILSSVGRWQGEEQTILKATEASNHPLRAVIYLKLDEATASERAQKSRELKDRGHRADDSDEYLHTRYDEFRTKTLPVIEFYRNNDLLIEVNGNQVPNEVTLEIIKKLSDRANKS